MQWLRSLMDRPDQWRARHAAGLIGPAACAALSVTLAACGPILQAAPSQSYLPGIHAPPASGTPTPGPLAYTVGAWPSNSAPPPNGQVTIYVSFRDVGAPVAGGHVSVTVQYVGRSRTFGPVSTKSDGLAAISVPVGGPLAINAGSREQSLQVRVKVVYQGQSYMATTNFTPLP